jgi:Glycosyl transferases group 1
LVASRDGEQADPGGVLHLRATISIDQRGALCCRNHVRRLAQDPNVDLSVCSCGPSDHEQANRAAVESLGASYTFVPFRANSEVVEAGTRRLSARRWLFHHEATAITQSHVDGAFMAWIAQVEPDVVIVDYVPSVSFIRSVYSAPVPRVTITLNREGAFYRGLRNAGTVPPDSSRSWIANLRLDRFEKWVYRNSDAIVALSSGDLPTWRGRPRVRVVMPPALDPSPRQWGFTGPRSLVFVGNVGHYPNREAVEWLTTRLAPELESIGSDTQIRIIGASAESVPGTWLRPNVVFLGLADEEAVTDEFVSAGLFIAPIANSFGSKMKLVECVSYATPFIATTAALTGLPFLRDVPRIRLNEPQAAAKLIEEWWAKPQALLEMSARLTEDLASFLVTQSGQWGALLASLRRA